MRKKTKKILGKIALGLGAVVGGGLLLFNMGKPTVTKKEEVIPKVCEKEINDGNLFV